MSELCEVIRLLGAILSKNYEEGKTMSPTMKAAREHFHAKAAEARVRLDLYTNHPLAVGDHSNVVEEVVKATQDYESAVSCMEILDAVAKGT